MYVRVCISTPSWVLYSRVVPSLGPRGEKSDDGDKVPVSRRVCLTVPFTPRSLRMSSTSPRLRVGPFRREEVKNRL